MPRNAASSLARALAWALAGASVFVASIAWGADEARRAFDVPAGDATETLKVYASQAHREFIFPSKPLKGVRTNAVQGELSPREAIEQLIANTGLTVVEDAATGILMINYSYGALRTDSKAGSAVTHSDPPRPDAGDSPPRKTPLSSAASAVKRVLQSLAAPNPEATETKDETIRLDPFKVSGESDVGFVSATSLAGGRMAIALKDSPVAYSVLTTEFLEAFNITNAAQAADFAVNSAKYEGSGVESGLLYNPLRIRGQAANPPTRNFFPYLLVADSYNVDRLDFARGANATLFGAGGAVGTMNTVTKQATPKRIVRELRLQAGSWNRYRVTADLNQPLNDKAAVRANLLWASGDDWRDRGWEDKRGIHLAAIYELTPRIRLRAEGEYRINEKAIGSNRLKDQLSAWDGKFTANGPNLSLTATQMATAGVARYGLRFIRDPDNLATATNYQNQFQTQGAAYIAGATNYLNGQPIRSVGFSMRNAAMTDVFFSPERYTAIFAGAPTFNLPKPTDTPLWDRKHGDWTARDVVRGATASLSYSPVPGLFVELSADVSHVEQLSEYTINSGMYATYLDLLRNKPDGAPNPYFLERYSEYNHLHIDVGSVYQNTNFQLAYLKDGRWGQLQVGILAGIQHEDRAARMQFLMLPLQNVLGRGFNSFFPQNDQNPQAIYTRQYANFRGLLPTPYTRQTPIAVYDPVSGRRDTVTPFWAVQPSRPDLSQDAIREFKFIQAATTLHLFKNRLVVIGAVRRDSTRLATDQFLLADDMPANWDGKSVITRPKAPADYWSLTFQQKDASGLAISGPKPADTRPRQLVNGANVGLPQYASDRFRDDFSAPDILKSVNTRALGAVFNLTRGLGLYGNESTTFSINNPFLDVRNKLLDPTASHSFDAGLRATIPNGKLAVSVGWFRAHQDGAFTRVLSNFRQNYDAISAAAPVGDTSENGRNIRGVQAFPGVNVFSTQTLETTGYEAELTANFTRAWRMVLNAGTSRPVQRDSFPDLPSYFVERDPLMRQILADAGVIIDAGNQATINPAVNDPSRINVAKTQAAVDAWNNLQVFTIPDVLAQAATKFRVPGGPELTANLATDYRISTGVLAGLRVGIALNYRGRQVVGSRTADTIVDPANPSRAIPDPTGGATSYLFVPSFYKGTATLSYTVRLTESKGRLPKAVQFDLTIDNLFNLRGPVADFSRTFAFSLQDSLTLAPRNYDISSPAVMSVPGSKNWQPPRNFTFSAKLVF